MSEAADARIAELEREVRALQEMLFLVLEEVAEPVQVPAKKMKEKITTDRMIDVTLDTDEQFWTFRTVEVPSDVKA